jgi:hypothetical protein
MSRKNQFNLISIILAVCSITMLYLGYTLKMWPPAITGIGFLGFVWALQLIKSER